MVFAALIICLAVLEATRAGFGYPAGWLERVAGRNDTAPRFAQTSPSVDYGRPLRIISLATSVPATPAGTVAGNPSGDAPTTVSPDRGDEDPAPERPAAQAPVALNTSALGRVEPTRTVSRSAPLRVYVAGDSAAEPLGYEVQRLSAADGLITAVVDFKVSSGLANPGYFNWPARLEQAMAARPAPEVVVLFLGGNDHLQMRGQQGTVQPGQPGWIAEYTRRAGEMMDIAGRGGARVYWVGMPVVRDPARNSSVAAVNAAFVAAAAERPWVRYLDIAPLFGDVDGGYSAYRPDAEGEQTRVRQDDGIHLAQAGSQWVATLLFERIMQDFAPVR
jgi:hypothetical protein